MLNYYIGVCPRCGSNHGERPFQELTRPSNPLVGELLPYTHWAMCPTTHEPIMLAPEVASQSRRLAVMT